MSSLSPSVSAASMPSPSVVQPIRCESDVVHHGWLLKRGEHLKTWRDRYFVLFRDGALLGFKTPPGNDYSNPLNIFTVHNVQYMKVDHPRPFTLLIRGLQFTNVIERTLSAATYESREEWCKAIQLISDNLKTASPQAEATFMLDNTSQDSVSATHDHFQVRHDKVTLQDFVFLKVLGLGSFGKVLLCREIVSSKFYALKILSKKVIVEKDEVAHTYTENRVLYRCKHPFLTNMAYSFQTKERLCFVMDFAIGGDLYYHLNCEMKLKKTGFDENRSRFYGAEITSGLGYLHDNNVVYRDLKLENLLLDKDGHIKIADFGLCKEDISFQDRTKTFCGTPEYLAPEVLEDNDYGRSVDWWGLGVVMYEMMCGRLPFFSSDHDKLFQLILKGTLRFPSRLSMSARNFLAGLLIRDPNRRLGGGPQDWHELKNHPFFQTIDWNLLYNRQIEPPFKPDLKSETDLKYFDTEFTTKHVKLTPPDKYLNALDDVDDELFQSQFTKFSFHDTREPSSQLHNEELVDAPEPMEQ